MKPPQAFYDFTLQLHQDLDLVYPGWASEAPNARWELYEDFRQGFGDQAVQELAVYFKRLLNDKNSNLESIWSRESKADWMFGDEGVRQLFEDFEAWASSL